MPIELTANTDAGARLVAVAERLAEELAARAAEHDRDGTFPFEAIDALKARRRLRGTGPRRRSAGSASRPRTTSSWRRVAWRAATPPWRSA